MHRLCVIVITPHGQSQFQHCVFLSKRYSIFVNIKNIFKNRNRKQLAIFVNKFLIYIINIIICWVWVVLCHHLSYCFADTSSSAGKIKYKGKNYAISILSSSSKNARVKEGGVSNLQRSRGIYFFTILIFD